MATDTSSRNTQSGTGDASSATQQGAHGQQGGTQQMQRSGSQALQGSGQQQRRGMQGVARYSRNPLAVMQELSHDLDRLFASFFYGNPTAQGQGQGQGGPSPAIWVPQIEMREDGDKLRVSVDLPGVGKERVRVDIDEGVLVVQGERIDERSESDEQQGVRRTERFYGAFHRAIPLPDGVDTENAQAEMKDGVLEIVLPLAQRSQSRRLDIKGGSGSGGSGGSASSGGASGSGSSGSSGGASGSGASGSGTGSSGTASGSSSGT
jgi:HSP20 family protein